MKKLIYLFFTVSIFGISIVGCKKDVIQKNQINSPLSKSANGIIPLYEVKNNMLVISSVEVFDSIISIIDDKLIDDLKKLSYVSYIEEVKEDSLNTIEDDFLSVVLNKDQVVQIGNYIYKINKTSSKVFAIHKNNFKSYSDLISENKLNNDVLEFSTEDNVFELLSEYKFDDSEKALSKKCQSSKFENNGGWYKYADFTDVNNIYSNGTDKNYKFSVHLLVRYDNWGIYRKLFTEFKHKELFGGTWNHTNFSFGFQVSYIAKDGSAGYDDEYPTFAFALNPNYTGTSNYFYVDHSKEIIHYRKTKCLSDFDLKSWVWFRDRQTLTPRLYPNSGSLRITS
jgi:hypothetical protein